jgi:hypothetical protein
VGIDFAQGGDGVLAQEQRVEVAAAGEHQSVEGLEHTEQGGLIVSGRQDDRRPAGAEDALVISFEEFARAVGIVAGEANQRGWIRCSCIHNAENFGFMSTKIRISIEKNSKLKRVNSSKHE